MWRVTVYENQRDWAKIGKPQDRGEWYMSAAEVNAYYNPRMNEVVIPAGIIKPPFFSTQDDALNFGGLGTVIGHEITHGFDDEGCKFDGQGNLRDWWSPADRENFDKLAALVEQQFNGYTVLDGKLALNGKLVLGESIADLGGLRLALRAYAKTTQKETRQGTRWVQPGAALLPGQRPHLGHQHPLRLRTHPGQPEQTPSRALPGQRTGFQHARILQSLQLPGQHPHDAGPIHSDLVGGRAVAQKSSRVIKSLAHLLILLSLGGSYGCTRSAEVQAEEQRLEDLQGRLDVLKENIKNLPRLQVQVQELERENRQLARQLKKRHP